MGGGYPPGGREVVEGGGFCTRGSGDGWSLRFQLQGKTRPANGACIFTNSLAILSNSTIVADNGTNIEGCGGEVEGPGGAGPSPEEGARSATVPALPDKTRSVKLRN